MRIKSQLCKHVGAWLIQQRLLAHPAAFLPLHSWIFYLYFYVLPTKLTLPNFHIQKRGQLNP